MSDEQLAHHPLGWIRIVEYLRSAVLEEERAQTHFILYRRLRTDVELMRDPHVRPVRRNLLTTLRAAAPRGGSVVIEIPEPMWAGAFVRSMPIILISRLYLWSRRVDTHIVVYAIENMPWRRRFLKPVKARLLRRATFVPVMRAWTVRAVLTILSALFVRSYILGTAAAFDTYSEAGFLRLADVEVLDPLWPKCKACFPVGKDVSILSERPKKIVFAAHPRPEKGLPDLLASWKETELASAGWELLVAVPEQSSGFVIEGVEEKVRLLQGPSREALHREFSTSRIVVLPSRDLGSWREQIGLSIVEGMAHGTLVICGSTSGSTDVVSRIAAGRAVESRRELTIALRELAAESEVGRSMAFERYLAGYASDRYPATRAVWFRPQLAKR